MSIAMQRVCKRYGDRVVLRDFSMTLPEGRVTCLMGPSGTGKTTVLRLLCGLEKPDAGSITGLENLRLAVVFQEDRLLDWLDATENLRLTNPGLKPEAVGEALRRFGLGDCAGQPVVTLSGGMKRRVALLRALLYDGDALLLDEPFKGLDEATRATVIRETLSLTTHKTVLLITHDPEEAALMGADIINIQE